MELLSELIFYQFSYKSIYPQKHTPTYKVYPLRKESFWRAQNKDDYVQSAVGANHAAKMREAYNPQCVPCCSTVFLESNMLLLPRKPTVLRALVVIPVLHTSKYCTNHYLTCQMWCKCYLGAMGYKEDNLTIWMVRTLSDFLSIHSQQVPQMSLELPCSDSGNTYYCLFSSHGVDSPLVCIFSL